MRKCQIGFEDALEFDQRLLVKGHVVKIDWRDARLIQTIGNRLGGKSRVTFAAIKPLLLSCRDDLSVPDQGRGGIVIEGRDTKNVYGHRPCVRSPGMRARQLTRSCLSISSNRRAAREMSSRA